MVNDDGSICWFKDDKWHREDGPCLETLSGFKVWRIEGKCHRLDGPARIWPNGKVDWCINGIRYNTISEWLKANESLTTDEKILFRLTYD
jgi:hypothetical protein